MAKSLTLFGIHSANIILNKYPESIINLYIQSGSNKNKSNTNKRLEDIVNLANKYKINPKYLDNTKLEKLAGAGFAGSNHQGVIIECKQDLIFRTNTEDDLKQLYQAKLEKDSKHKFFILILDEIQDPHNLGACIRTAEAMGVDFIITPKNNSASLSATVCKVSAGAALLLSVFQVTNLARTIKWLKQQGIWVYGTDMAENSRLGDLDLTDSIALVMGAEGTGIRRLTSELCDQVFTIPMYGETQSLNVSVATGVCLYEVTRQRLAAV